jgi:cytosine/adenosine deaminase-related metal-dependent hydrolase
LQLDHLVGSIEVGKRADLAVFRLPRTPRDRAAAMLSSGVKSARGVLVDGRVLVWDGALSYANAERVTRRYAQLVALAVRCLETPTPQRGG